MSSRRLIARIGSATRYGIGRLKGHRLVFHKVSRRDCSGKCDAEFTGNTADVVWGVLFEVPEAVVSELDRLEDWGYGYERRRVHIQRATGPVEAYTYIAIKTDPTLRPMRWYKEHVLRGAEENRLPADYVDAIESVDAIIDPDKERAARELDIYNR